jgi:ribonucleoside-diphosphate reductase alpha chain
VEESPYYKSTANEINWINRVRLQGMIQKYVDNSISSTVNLPNNVTVETVKRIYMEAWKEGLKGITIYRDGSRTGVLVSEQKEEVEQPTKRPKSIPCDVFHLKVKGEDYTVIVGLLNNIPYEVMAYQGNGNILGKKVKSAVSYKVKRGHYRLIDSENDNTLIDSITGCCDDAEDSITRLVSAHLRHNPNNLEFIVHQLEKAKGDMTNFSKAIARTLKKYIQDGVEIKGEECPNCQAKLFRNEGCISCKNCGFSKC